MLKSFFRYLYLNTPSKPRRWSSEVAVYTLRETLN